MKHLISAILMMIFCAISTQITVAHADDWDHCSTSGKITTCSKCFQRGEDGNCLQGITCHFNIVGNSTCQCNGECPTN